MAWGPVFYNRKRSSEKRGLQKRSYQLIWSRLAKKVLTTLLSLPRMAPLLHVYEGPGSRMRAWLRLHTHTHAHTQTHMHTHAHCWGGGLGGPCGTMWDPGPWGPGDAVIARQGCHNTGLGGQRPLTLQMPPPGFLPGFPFVNPRDSMRGPWVVSVGLGWALRRSWVWGERSRTKAYIDKLPIHRHRAAATRNPTCIQYTTP